MESARWVAPLYLPFHVRHRGPAGGSVSGAVPPSLVATASPGPPRRGTEPPRARRSRSLACVKPRRPGRWSGSAPGRPPDSSASASPRSRALAGVGHPRAFRSRRQPPPVQPRRRDPLRRRTADDEGPRRGRGGAAPRADEGPKRAIDPPRVTDRRPGMKDGPDVGPLPTGRARAATSRGKPGEVFWNTDPGRPPNPFSEDGPFI